MEQNEFVASLVLICFLMSVNSNSTDDNDLLRVKFKCTQGDYYDLEYGGCVRCTVCKRENMKTMTPCSLHSDTVCRDCEDGYEKQQQGTSIRCIRLQSADKNDDLVHPGGDNDLALNSSPSQPSHSTTVTVTQTSTERKPINNASTSDDINAPIPIRSSDISIFMEHNGTIAIIALVLITAAILVVLLVSKFSKGSSTPKAIINANTGSNFAVTFNENNCFNNEQPRRGPKTWDSSRRRSRNSSTDTGAEQGKSLLNNSLNSDASVSRYPIPAMPSPVPSIHRQGGVIDADHKQVWDNMEPPLNQLRQ